MRALAATALAVLAACSAPAPRDGAAPRVVSLHDVTTEIVVAVGAVERLVGVAAPVDLEAGAAAATAHVPEVAGLESIVAADPDLVLGTGVVAERDPELVAALRARGVELVLADPARLEDVAALVRDLSARVGGDPAAALAPIEATLAAPRPPGDVPVLVYDCCDPPFTAGARAVETDLLARAGGRNVFADVEADWAHVSWEEAIARRPALIVVHEYPYGGQDDAAGKRATLARVPALADVPVVVVPLRDVIGGLGSVRGLAALQGAIAEVR